MKPISYQELHDPSVDQVPSPKTLAYLDDLTQNLEEDQKDNFQNQSDLTPVGIPVCQSGPTIVIAIPATQDIKSNDRVWEIDYVLNHGVILHRWCLWICLSLSILNTVYAGFLTMISGNEIGLIFVAFFTFGCYCYSLGIRAMKKRSVEKNQLFRKLAIVCIIGYICLFVVSLHLGLLIPLYWLLCLINGIVVYSTANEVTTLLIDRKVFLNSS